jgi:hypothetical protein
VASEHPFGCDRCYAGEVEQAWRYAAEDLVVEDALVEDSHFVLQLRRCPSCGQRFVWVFTEVVDFEGGDDAQFRSVVPVTESEGDAFAQQGEDVDYGELAGLGRDRRYLSRRWPTGAPEPEVSWQTGPLLFA